jgi:hypothetical protein
LRRDGTWFLLVTVDLPEGTPLPITDFIGVDLGIITSWQSLMVYRSPMTP